MTTLQLGDDWRITAISRGTTWWRLELLVDSGWLGEETAATFHDACRQFIRRAVADADALDGPAIRKETAHAYWLLARALGVVPEDAKVWIDVPRSMTVEELLRNAGLSDL